MAGAATLKFTRAEGGPGLVQEESGLIRLLIGPPRGYEALLIGRGAAEAIHLTQHISADSSVSHALAAAQALEQAAEIELPSNGRIMRDLLHTLSLLHAHTRHFYFQLLPDYLSLASFSDYGGQLPEAGALGRAVAKHGKAHWSRQTLPDSFSASEAAGLEENGVRAGRALTVLQQMMAVIGGKFPVPMSIVPGGISLPVRETGLIRLRELLGESEDFLSGQPNEDARLLIRRYPELKRLGRGAGSFLSAGSLGDETGPDASHFPAGVFLGGVLQPLQPHITESIHNAFYRITRRADLAHGLAEPDPGKGGAYGWIKAPRYLGKVAETGALARLVITHLSGARSHGAPTVRGVEELTGGGVAKANNVAGRILARMGELTPLVQRCRDLLENLAPGQPTVGESEGVNSASGEGTGFIEAPAGAVRHGLALERGRVGFYDIISPSTWNGGTRDENDLTAGLEIALNGDSLDLSTSSGRLSASRIIHSYFFSATDAVQ